MTQERHRPSPEQILARITHEEADKGPGRLKIILGAAAGVGKTYTMLEIAHEMLHEGADVVAGCVVTHGREETEALLSGIEIIPEFSIEYRGTLLKEFNLDAVLARRPQFVLVDELAHTNAPGSRHEKRWQDVDELLSAGINVFTTLNIQHLESINDMVAQITGIKVSETVPDYIFEKAYEIELVDLPPDDLIKRLEEGKVYVPETSKLALENFFKKPNLIALRELALRLTAERVDAQMEKYRPAQQVWPASDRLLVCVGPSPLSIRLVRATKRMAAGLHSEWLAVFVETPATAGLPDRARKRISKTLRLAERLGAETVTLSGRNPSEELVRYAQRRNVTKIVIGKPARPRWREILFGSIVDDLIRRSGTIDIYVITGDSSSQDRPALAETGRPPDLQQYMYATGIVAIATILVKFAFSHLALVNLVMIYQLAVVITALKFGKGPSILSAILSVAVFDFFFVPPYLSFAISDTQYLITFAVMLTVGLTLSTLTSALKQQAELSRSRERQTAALYALTREQAAASSRQAVISTSVKHISDVFECKVCLLLADPNGQLKVIEHNQESFLLDSKETGVAQWSYINRQPAGLGTDTLSGAQALYLPLNGATFTLGVVAILPAMTTRFEKPDELHLLETFVNQMALAIERAELSEKAGNGHKQVKPGG